jgi:hypothetical protein
MKIVFLCGGLEPGRDGVGDYTIKLAIELTRHGHQIFPISLNDKYRTEIINDEKDNHGISILRLPHNLSNEIRFEIVEKQIQKYKPDWLSIQFVIYSFHPKGLPFGLGKQFENLCQNYNCHIMFHEIWIGISKISSLKEKTFGFFQKRIIKSIVKSVRPRVITTSNILYKLVLKSIDIDAKILPVFSNIDVAPKNKFFLHDISNRIGLTNIDELVNWQIIGIFGHLHVDANLEPMLKEQLAFCESKNLKVAFIAFGRIGENGIKVFKHIEKNLSAHIKFLYLGEQSQENISNILQIMNVGISSTQLPYIGKSGAYAAMKLHSLTVLVPEQKVFPEYNFEIKKYQSETDKQDAQNWSVVKTSERLINLLSIS